MKWKLLKRTESLAKVAILCGKQQIVLHGHRQLFTLAHLNWFKIFNKFLDACSFRVWQYNKLLYHIRHVLKAKYSPIVTRIIEVVEH